MTEPQVRTLLDVTARTTFVLFLGAFCGLALRNLRDSGFSRWLAGNHDRFILAFTASHTVHLAGIIMLARVMGRRFFAAMPWPVLMVGGSVFVLIYCLAAAALMRMRGQRARWIGSMRFEIVVFYIMWTLFALAFVMRIFSGSIIYAVLGTAAVAAPIIRIVGMRRGKALASAA